MTAGVSLVVIIPRTLPTILKSEIVRFRQKCRWLWLSRRLEFRLPLCLISFHPTSDAASLRLFSSKFSRRGRERNEKRLSRLPFSLSAAAAAAVLLRPATDEGGEEERKEDPPRLAREEKNFRTWKTGPKNIFSRPLLLARSRWKIFKVEKARGSEEYVERRYLSLHSATRGTEWRGKGC